MTYYVLRSIMNENQKHDPTVKKLTIYEHVFEEEVWIDQGSIDFEIFNQKDFGIVFYIGDKKYNFFEEMDLSIAEKLRDFLNYAVPKT